jgi:predicted transcriptional regulator
MTVKEITEKINLKVFCGEQHLQNKVSGGYVSDLLSDVMGNASEGEVWITLQSHMNVVAIASLRELSAIILINGIQPEPAILKKAEEEKIPILGSDEPAFHVAGALYNVLNK